MSERDELVRLDEPELAAHLVDSGDVPAAVVHCGKCGKLAAYFMCAVCYLPLCEACDWLHDADNCTPAQRAEGAGR